MRRGPRLPAAALAPFLFEVAPPRPDAHAAPPPAPLAWAPLFANPHPVEIEVGFGKGLFLVSAGAARPDSNFFGIEIERKYVLFTATRLAKRDLRNVKVASADARWFLPLYVGDATVAAVHVYFPDPWWKNRHRKRRLFTEEFARQCARVLQVGGRLHLVSDVHDYFVESVEMLTHLEALRPEPPPDVKGPEHDMDYLTNFERKYRREGRPIYRGAWRKQ